jgi:hypothetical protein
VQVHSTTVRKVSTEIPTPQFVVVESYERDYSATFVQPPSYLRGRGRFNIFLYNYLNSKHIYISLVLGLL